MGHEKAKPKPGLTIGPSFENLLLSLRAVARARAYFSEAFGGCIVKDPEFDAVEQRVTASIVASLSYWAESNENIL